MTLFDLMNMMQGGANSAANYLGGGTLGPPPPALPNLMSAGAGPGYENDPNAGFTGVPGVDPAASMMQPGPNNPWAGAMGMQGFEDQEYPTNGIDNGSYKPPANAPWSPDWNNPAPPAFMPGYQPPGQQPSWDNVAPQPDYGFNPGGSTPDWNNTAPPAADFGPPTGGNVDWGGQQPTGGQPDWGNVAPPTNPFGPPTGYQPNWGGTPNAPMPPTGQSPDWGNVAPPAADFGPPTGGNVDWGGGQTEDPRQLPLPGGGNGEGTGDGGEENFQPPARQEYPPVQSPGPITGGQGPQPVNPMNPGWGQKPSLGAPIFPGGGGGGDFGGGNIGGGGAAAPPSSGGDNSAFIRGLAENFQGAMDKANAANEKRYEQGIKGYEGLDAAQGQRLGGVQGRYDQSLNDLINNLASTLGGYGARNAATQERLDSVDKGYADREARVQGRLDNLGQTEAENIRERFGKQASQAEQDLISRGLGNTTLRTTALRGVDLDRNRALTELAEKLMRERNTMDLQASGDTLASRKGTAGTLADLSGQGLQAAERFAGQQTDVAGRGAQAAERANEAQTGVSKQLLDFIERRTDQGPSWESLAQLAMALGAAGQNGNVAMPAANNTPPNLPTPNTPIFQPTQQQPDNIIRLLQQFGFGA